MAQAEVSRISLKIPNFWRKDPVIWFAQLEAQFINAHVVADLTKYYYVIGAINSDVLSHVSDYIRNPPPQNLYDGLKARLIAAFSLSNEAKFDQLLHHTELGDRKPSQLLRHMRDLAGDTIPADLLRMWWIKKLPSTIQSIILIQEGQLDQLALMADKIFESSQVFVATSAATYKS